MSTRDNERSDGPPDHDEVGYGRPPLHHRFKDSGNPRGRPKGSKNRKTIVKAVASEMHTVSENGKHRRRSTLQLVVLRLRNMAMEGGKGRVFEEFRRILEAYEPQAVDNVGGYIVVPETATDEQMEIEAKKLNAAAEARQAARLKRLSSGGEPTS